MTEEEYEQRSQALEEEIDSLRAELSDTNEQHRLASHDRLLLEDRNEFLEERLVERTKQLAAISTEIDDICYDTETSITRLRALV